MENERYYKYFDLKICHFCNLGERCVSAADCPCYMDGIEYPAGTVMEQYCQNW